jgi:DNA-binding NarL/FixJ family response regulator
MNCPHPDLHLLPYCGANKRFVKMRAHASEGHFRTMSKSVLIVDDNQAVRKVMRGFFEALTDWIVKGEARDGAEAIQKAIELTPDLILLDFSMPNMNGLEAASVIKKMFPDVHIILFTMFDDALGSRLSAAVGVDLVVPKAEGLTSLVKSVRHLMGTSGLIKNTHKSDHREPSAAN